MIILETDRLILREMTHGDLDALHEFGSDPIAMTYFPAVHTRESSKEWIDRNIASYRDNAYGLWALVDKSEQVIVGYCGLILQKDVDGEDEVEIGYGLIRKYWGQGYATEAALACKEYVFKELGLRRTISLIDPGNQASIEVAKRNGMQLEKRIQRWDKAIDVYAAHRT